MPSENFKNFGRTTLAATLAQGATSATVEDGADLPAAAPFHVVVDEEIILVGAISGDTISNLSRGQKNTQDVAHAAGSQVIGGTVLAHHLEELYETSQPNVSARISQTGTFQTIPAASSTKVLMDTVSWDTVGNMADLANDRLYARVTGKYIVTAAIVYGGQVGTGMRHIGIRKNGGAVGLVENQAESGGSLGTHVSTGAVITMAAGDYVELWTYNSYGSSQQTYHADDRIFLAMSLISGGAQPNTPAARVNITAGAVISSGPNTALSFGAERWDTDSIWNSTQPTRLTCQTAGKYTIGGVVEWPANTTGQREVQVRLNGSTILAVERENTVSSGTVHQTISTDWEMKVGDYVELVVAQNSGTSLTIPSGWGPYNGDFWMTMHTGGLARNATPPAAVTAAAHTNSAFSVPYNSWTHVTFTSSPFDTDGMWDSSSPTRLTARRDGRYLVTGNLVWSDNTTGRRIVGIGKNGGVVGNGRTESAPNAGVGSLSHGASAILDLKAGDYVTLSVYQSNNAAVALPLGSEGSYSAKLEVALLSGNPDPVVPTATIWRSTNQAMVTGTDTLVSFSQALVDTDNMWNLSTPTRLTVKTAGYYVFDSFIQQATGVGLWAFILKNGAESLGVDTSEKTTTWGNESFQVSTPPTWMNVGDYVEVKTAHNAGANRDIQSSAATASAPRSPTLSAHMIAPGVRGGTETPPNNVAAKAHRGTAAQSIPHAVDTAITFTATDFDTDGIWNSAAPTRLTCRTPGKYLVTADLAYAANGTGWRQLLIKRNGTTFVGGLLLPVVSSTVDADLNASVMLDLKAGDYVELFAVHNAGTAINAGAEAGRYPVLSMALVSGTANPIAPASRVSRLASYNHTSTGNWMSISFDTQESDTDMLWDSTAPTRLTCRTPGYYTIVGYLGWDASNTTGVRYTRLLLNGVDQLNLIGPDSVVASLSPGRGQAISAVVRLNLGDYVEMQGWQNSGSNTLIMASSAGGPHLSAVMAAPFGELSSTVASMPRGVLGLASKTSTQNFTTEADITGLSVSVNVDAGRRIRISFVGGAYHNVANAQVVFNIKEGSTLLRGVDVYMAGMGNGIDTNSSVVLTPAAGAHTYKVTGQVTVGGGTGTLNASATDPAQLLVEDIGSA